MSEMLNLFKASYWDCRKDHKIYKGFDLNFRDNVTEYFLHHDNQGHPPTTYMSQAIGEAVIFYCENLKTPNKYIKEIHREDDSFQIHITIPQDWYDNNIINSVVGYYTVRFYYEKDEIFLSVYNKNGDFIMPDFDSPLYEFLPLCVVVLAYDYNNQFDIRELVNDFVNNPNIKAYVKLSESFYQTHKFDMFDITDYVDLGK